MSTMTINSVESLQRALGNVRDQYDRHHYLRMSLKTGKDRSLDQNAISHAFYEQLARELREDDALGWKCFCKLNFGVPIMRAEDPEFREFYDAAIKSSLSYEQKIGAMKYLPVTSLMTKPQLSRFLEVMQEHFLMCGVVLMFPDSEVKK